MMGDVATGNQTTALLSLHSSYQWQQGHMVRAQAHTTDFNICSVRLSCHPLHISAARTAEISAFARQQRFFIFAEKEVMADRQTRHPYILKHDREKLFAEILCATFFPSNRNGLAAGGETVYGTWSIVFWTGPECSNEAATGDPLQESTGSVLERETVGVCVFVVSVDAGRNSKSVLQRWQTL